MTINSEINTLSTAISNMKTEIVNKGQPVSSTDTVASLKGKIENISNKNGLDFSKTPLNDIVEGTIENLYDKVLLYIRPFCFTGCDKFKKAEFTKLKKICPQAFHGCNQFSTLILSGNNVVRLESINAFRFTKIENFLGKIYVNNSLVNKYKAQNLDDGTPNNWYYFRSLIDSVSNYSE